MAVEKGKFPATTASFVKIRERGMYYVDKTHLLWQLVNTLDVVFLSRPRRFGKSMLLKTIGCYLEGQRELFEGLEIMPLEEARGEKGWVRHPVLHFDFSKRGPSVEGIQQIILREVRKYARRNGISLDSTLALEALEELLERLEEEGSPRVGILIDEYDAPLLDALAKGDADLLEEIKACLRGFYKTLKAADDSLRFLMATGISQFRQVGLFSGFNNIRDISFSPEYNAICGFTERELRGTLGEQVAHMAEVNGLSIEEQFDALKHKYDGYRFSKKEEDVYNPFGLMNALMECELKDYWSRVGTASSADILVPRYDALGVVQLDATIACEERVLARFDYERPDPIPFLYQTGYLTIKGLNEEGDYLLDFPNYEVRESIMLLLAPRTLGLQNSMSYPSLNRNLVRALNGTDIKTLEVCIQAFLANLPFDRGKETEASTWELREERYRDALHLIFAGVRSDVRVEQIGAGGISDVEIIGAQMVVIIELKVKRRGMTAEKALAQTLANGYPDKHAGGEKPVWAVGAVIGKKAQIEWMEKCVWEGKA